MGVDCKLRDLQLKVARIYVEVCKDEAEARISPIWDVIGRYEYVAVGTVDEVIKKLKQLTEDILKAVKALEDIAEEVKGSSEH